ncbi:2-hydroxychromene-2-carboxylate isomerase [Caldimonas thermodepolymerans]|mgnify:CR=1 FL=1|uniref:2-hydroxychromene-2-carboxylate isomerase n=1 Tax=Caldimonas thermodepolymerans TaxID=215580 RepID=A0A2S5T578_9BURK|nr:2-hydroxychromene-2-carboxylate isomerase [Caldimonas thermodepolymerans]PPE70102.1 2-hydroxychromene-2-carboxylate isomerase [Caldimonas thermodepolymerans]QPC31848.1 2-hydroxychromene-2-carboxylate isomerase [Caldimonas thermodepolymerans]RDI01643.1 2-hydroxychromene-2-carboxylate isomerase [Caldimonas thermodepolymerans]TCP05780.1 2-hydroxychromene-2-carboxylate isomerase [Caldimonas thermodepolymerans]UZG44633.1 2-hydroxychromene-2-carboxylate isomerase [Caldimonas thermodepolymerans]
MSLAVDYYFAPQSPYAYLGHERFWNLVRKYGATLRVRPVDLGGKVFPVSGGVPLNKRAPQRQAYRLLELRRFGEYLGLPINVEPRFFPVNGDDAAKLIIAVDMKDGTEAAMKIAGAVMRAVWVEERNIADEAVLVALLAETGLPASRIEDAHSQAAHERYELDTELAIEAGVFGAPTYVIEGELFWGQDRLDFVERRLAKG